MPAPSDRLRRSGRKGPRPRAALDMHPARRAVRHHPHRRRGLCLLSFDTERMGYAALSNDLRQWTLYSCDPADVCFVDGYACVDAREDRARIMEYFMVHEAAAQLLIESPVIRRKLRLMCGAVRDNFDTTGWGQVRWESLL